MERVWAWKEKYGSTIINQLKKLGCACDWSRERFTMDEGCSAAVREVFVDLYEKGLIYQGNRIINWCPNCKTALSDVEVEYTEKEGQAVAHSNIKVKDSDEVVVCATTRPETMLGDTGIAVNPNDERYTASGGQNRHFAACGQGDPRFCRRLCGDGVWHGLRQGHALRTTPDDFEVGQRHELDVIYGHRRRRPHDRGLRQVCRHGPLRGAATPSWRTSRRKGCLRKVEELHHNVGVCYRCGTDGGAHDLDAVVRQNEAPGAARH